MNELIDRYLDDDLSAEEQQQLATWIKSRPDNAQQFAKAVMLHDRLQNEIRHGIPTMDDSKEYSDRSDPIPLPKPSPLNPRRLLKIAASIALTLTVIYSMSRPDRQNPTIHSKEAAFATLVHAVDAQYNSAAGLQLGHRFASEHLSLASGFVRLQFDSGVEVTLQGPAEYEFISHEQTRLSEGRLTASVPPGGEGFRVVTPNAEITDLGTAFGLELDATGASLVSVFSGEVAVAKTGSPSSQSLKEGEALKIENARAPSSMAFDPSRFEKHWPVSSGIEGSSGAFRLIPPWRRLRFARSDNRIFVRQEGFVGALHKPLEVNISKPGRYTRERQLTPLALPTGQNVKALILHYQPLEPRLRGDVKRLIGEITFARPILGLITQHEELKASARRFSNMSAGESHRRRELNLNGTPVGDIIELSSDRRTLRLNLASPMFSSDLIRVIVDAALPSLQVVANTEKKTI